jgi:aspartate kinase
MTLKTLAVMKFGGSLIDFRGTNIPRVSERITELKRTKDLGPLAVFSAPKGVTDKLQAIGAAKALNQNHDLDTIFSSYSDLAASLLSKNFCDEFQETLDRYRTEVEETLSKIDRRFTRMLKAKVLTSGGELPTAALMSFVLESAGLKSCFLDKANWPIITDDNFENAIPNLELSSKSLQPLLERLMEERIVCIGGFMGVTHDGLATLLGRGGSDQTAIILSLLLRDQFSVETILLKETPVQSADPKLVNSQELRRVPTMSYNEAQKATVSGMTILQNAAVRIARANKLPITVAPISDLQLGTKIQTDDPNPQPVKCVTGLTDCAVITMKNERSKSLEDCLVLWEDYDGFLDLGSEVMDTGQVLRDFLVYDAEFVRKNEERLRTFDKEMRVEYGLGIVTLVGDKMKDTPGVASTAINSIPRINIVRGIFAPHTSQIILVVNGKDVPDAIREIHHQLKSKGSVS